MADSSNDESVEEEDDEDTGRFDTYVDVVLEALDLF
jgi:hypothetical protein